MSEANAVDQSALLEAMKGDDFYEVMSQYFNWVKANCESDEMFHLVLRQTAEGCMFRLKNGKAARRLEEITNLSLGLERDLLTSNVETSR